VKAHWFRVELGPRGKVRSWRRVEAQGQDGVAVVYVLAESEAEVGRLAYNAYQRALLKARRAKLEAEGRCRCGRPKDLDGKRCSRCVELGRIYNRRRDAKRRGETVPPMHRKDRDEERKAEFRRDFELSILIECENALEACRTKADFGRWLAGRIANLQRRRAA
jgi:hypothetical protein